jgi:hypothetical protein
MAAARDASPEGAVLALADSLSRGLRVARALARSGRRVDLAGIDDACGLLCAKALDLPPEDGRRMADRLAAVLAEADLLTQALRGAR